MDCIDCHNRPTHIYKSADEALDERLLFGKIPRELPYIKKIAYEVVTREYASHEEAEKAIAAALMDWYKTNYPAVVTEQMELLNQAITHVQGAYLENVWPSMNIRWNTYRSLRGHINNSGCFRCHDGEHETGSGESISMECEACHIILAQEEANPDILRKIEQF
jgi:hypothetical protein